MELISIGRVESPLRLREEAPKQGDEGAPDAWLVFDAAVRDGLDGTPPATSCSSSPGSTARNATCCT